MTYEEKNKQKFESLVNIALENATGKGMHTGYKWLQDEYEDYFKWHEEAVEAGHLASFGGMSGGSHNRRILAMMVLRELGNGVGGRHLIDDQQYDKLSDTLDRVASGARAEAWKR